MDNTSLKPGDKAPDFTLPNQDGQQRTLSAITTTYVVLYFYPKDNTPGCTAQACNLRDNKTTLDNKDITVLGISGDNIASHKKFANAYTLDFDLLTDTEYTVAKRYGVYMQKSMYGKKYFGIQRTTFLITKGKIAHIFTDIDVSNHADQILQAIR